jgi:hypothetical protein
VVVSICSVSERNPISQSYSCSTSSMRCLSPDHERVAGGEELEAGVELGAVLERPGADVVKHAAAAGLLERVELQREVLLVGGHSGVADDLVAHRLKPSQNPRMGLRHPPRFRASVSRGPLSLLALGLASRLLDFSKTIVTERPPSPR